MAHIEGDDDPQAEQGSTNGRGGPPGDASPRTVAEEAALLVDLLTQRGGWAQGAGDGASGQTDSGPTDSGPTDYETGEASRGGPGRAGASDHMGAPRADGGAHECTCGGQTPQACRVCPVCQLISFVQKVHPETIERVADFALFAATALRDLAAAQRERRAPDDEDAATTTAGEERRAPDASAGAQRHHEDGTPAADRAGRGQGESS